MLEEEEEEACGREDENFIAVVFCFGGFGESVASTSRPLVEVLVGERKNLVTRRRMLGPEQTPRRDSEQVYTLRKRVEASRGCRSCATACFLRVSRHHASRQSRAGVRFGYPRPRHTSGGASCAKMSEYASTGAELMCRKERNSPFWGHFRTGPRMIYYLTRPLRANAGRILRAPAQGPTGMPKPASM